MSFFELRNFTDMMRTLGYPRFISIESFRQPNFPLVADILVWLLSKFDVQIPSAYETEQQRIFLIRTSAETLATKIQIKVNTKRLYQADNYAVKELLKVVTVLYNALDSDKSDENDEDEEGASYVPIDISSKIEDIKLARQLASDITTKGANFYDLLGKEVELRENRTIALSKHIELSKAEQAVKEQTQAAKTELEEVQKQIQGISGAEAALDAKIEKKRLELERTQKRLQGMQKVRPAFMEEYEKLESELAVLWEEYVIKHRILTYLEQAKTQVEQAEERRHQEQIAAVRKLLEASKTQEEMKFLDNSSLDNLTMMDDENKPMKTPSRMDVPGTGRKVFGSMTGAGLEDDEDDSASLLGSDSDLLLGGGQDSDLGTDDDDDIPLGDKMAANVAAVSGGPSAPKPQELSDDDF
ncbi:clusterin-associated protein 1 [Neocloeon triangulifer]|uniref:clusterin-associated protein 1 n=1 Tax=Neocloeon triangulifer TaxID=2078957 RepID=UPI00286EE638|nr:clusterin-associated protein 1 [Neocloeon triangulifer]